jgi:hypothetical protein
MSEPGQRVRLGRGSRPSPASLGIVKVDADFPGEYPGGDATCTEAYASLCRTGEALLGELDRHIATTFRRPPRRRWPSSTGQGPRSPPRKSATGS